MLCLVGYNGNKKEGRIHSTGTLLPLMQDFCSGSGGANPGHLHVTGADGPASPREGKAVGEWPSGG